MLYSNTTIYWKNSIKFNCVLHSDICNIYIHWYINMVYVFLIKKRKGETSHWCNDIFLFTNVFFLPFINVLFSIFNCTKGKHYYIKDYSCSGTYYYTIKRSIIYSNNKSLKFQYIKITHIYLLLHSKRINTIHYYSI